jgi:hypothetical protein
VTKPVWILIVVLLPVLGGILWLIVGRARPSAVARRRAPDDDPEFLGRIGSISDQDERIRRLEEELAQLDAEEEDPRLKPQGGPAATEDTPAAGAATATGAAPAPGTPTPPKPPARPGDGDDDARGQRGALG